MNFLRFILKSRQLVFGLVFTAILAATMIHAFWQPRVYQSSGTLQFYRNTEKTETMNSMARRDDWHEMEAALKSAVFIQRVAMRFTDEDRAAFMRPYAHALKGANDVRIGRLIRGNQRVSFDRGEWRLSIQYQHPDRLLAARVAGLLVNEVIAYHARLRIDESMEQVEALQLRAEQQERHVRELTEEMSACREARGKDSGKPFEPDEHYQALREKQEQEQKVLAALIGRLRDTTMIVGPVPDILAHHKTTGYGERGRLPPRANCFACGVGFCAGRCRRAFVGRRGALHRRSSWYKT